MARVLDGVATASSIKAELREQVESLRACGQAPCLGLLLVGDNPASRSYVLGKERDCAEVGIRSVTVEVPATASEDEILTAVEELNARADVTGYIVQLPLPDGIDENRVLERISPHKDADGLHPTNLGRLVLGVDPSGAVPAPLPCTPLGIVELMERHGIGLSGKHVVIIGRGTTVGRPLSLLLSRRGIDATVTQVHSRTPNIGDIISQGDVVVAAVGVPHFVQPEWVKEGAVVLDVGVTRVGTAASGKAKLAGDIDPGVAERASFLSPNPGGVGPMTRVMLVRNVLELARRSAS